MFDKGIMNGNAPPRIIKSSGSHSRLPGNRPTESESASGGGQTARSWISVKDIKRMLGGKSNEKDVKIEAKVDQNIISEEKKAPHIST